jgi:hypothetical protein
VNQADGKALAALPKWASASEVWTQDVPNCLSNVFGVLDAEGKAIKGLHVELGVFISPKHGNIKYVFTLWRVELGKPERAYQLHINHRRGLRPTDHAYSHEHYGQEVRINAEPSWATADFAQSIKLFCERCNLSLSGEVPHYQGITLA